MDTFQPAMCVFDGFQFVFLKICNLAAASRATTESSRDSKVKSWLSKCNNPSEVRSTGVRVCAKS